MGEIEWMSLNTLLKFYLKIRRDKNYLRAKKVTLEDIETEIRRRGGVVPTSPFSWW